MLRHREQQSRPVQRVVQLRLRHLLLGDRAAPLLSEELRVRLLDAFVQVGVEARHVPSNSRIDGEETGRHADESSGRCIGGVRGDGRLPLCLCERRCRTRNVLSRGGRDARLAGSERARAFKLAAGGGV